MTIEVRAFGGLDPSEQAGLPVPSPADRQVPLGVLAAGVGPWSASVRKGCCAVSQPSPVAPTRDLSGVIGAIAWVTHKMISGNVGHC